MALHRLDRFAGAGAAGFVAESRRRAGVRFERVAARELVVVRSDRTPLRGRPPSASHGRVRSAPRPRAVPVAADRRARISANDRARATFFRVWAAISPFGARTGRRRFRFSTTVRWLTAVQLSRSGRSKSRARARASGRWPSRYGTAPARPPATGGGPVAGRGIGRVWAVRPAESIAEPRCGKIRVQSAHRAAPRRIEDGFLARIRVLTGLRIRPRDDGMAGRPEPVAGGILPHRFGEWRHPAGAAIRAQPRHREIRAARATGRNGGTRHVCGPARSGGRSRSHDALSDIAGSGAA